MNLSTAALGSKLPKVLKNFTAYIDGFGHAGRVLEVEPPKLKLKTEELRAGGMDIPIEVDLGMEKLEATLTFAEVDPAVIKWFGNPESGNAKLVLRGVISAGLDNTPIIIELRGGFTELDPGSWKPGDKGSLKCRAAVRFYKLSIDGAEIVYIDIDNMVRRIGGIDQLEGQRKALGM